jgi:hypothetical protein
MRMATQKAPISRSVQLAVEHLAHQVGRLLARQRLRAGAPRPMILSTN